MNSDITNVKNAGTDARLSSNTIFELLLEERRRYMLYYLSRKVGAVSLDEIIEQIACREGVSTRERLEEIGLECHHNHLRKLIDSGVLEYDSAAGTVESTEAARALDPYLEIAFADDFH